MPKRATEKEVSKNERARRLLGLREDWLPKDKHYTIFDQPCELGFHCPVCKYELEEDGNFDERLQWSEYNGMIWCSVCNFDYPSALCQPDPVKATKIFLDTVAEVLWSKAESMMIAEREAEKLFKKTYSKKT